jgi:hypothetical protein
MSQSDAHEQLASGLGWFSIGLGMAEILAPRQIARLIGAPDIRPTHNVLRTYGVREITAGVGILANPKLAGWIWTRVAGDLLDIGSVVAGMFCADSDRARGSAALGALAGVTALDYYCASKLSDKSASNGTTPDGEYE